MSFHHIPVLLAECIDGLAIRPDGIYLDGTAGGAGHSKEIAARLTTGRLIALDQDPDAVAAASQRLEGLPATVVQSNFRYADRALAQLGVDGLDGVLLDLGFPHTSLTRSRAAFRIRRRAAGHAHEPERPHGRRPCEHRLPRGIVPYPQGIRRGAVCLADRREDRKRPRRRTH